MGARGRQVQGSGSGLAAGGRRGKLTDLEIRATTELVVGLACQPALTGGSDAGPQFSSSWLKKAASGVAEYTGIGCCSEVASAKVVIFSM